MTLLDQILADPLDDAPRLVYADQIGGPRGELIAVQCAAARLDPDDPGRHALERRADDLLAEHGAAWSAELREIEPLGDHPDRIAWRRGFVDEVRLQYDELDVIPAIRAVTPLCALVAVGTAADDEAGVGDHGVAGLVAARLPALRALRIAAARCGAPSIQALADSALLPRLERLELGIREATDPSPLLPAATALRDLAVSTADAPWFFEDLAASPVAARLETLRTDAPAHHVAAIELPALRELALASLDDAGARALAAATGLPRLRRLRVGAARLSDAAERELAERWRVDVAGREVPVPCRYTT